jgi:hypothetical protein
MSNEQTIHYVKVVDVEFRPNEEDPSKDLVEGFELKGRWFDIDDAMYLKDDFFDGVISETYFSSIYIKLLDDDKLAVALVTC